MRVVMLDPDQRNLLLPCDLLRHQPGIVFRVQVADNDLRLHLQKCLCLVDRILERPDRPDVRQVSHISGRIEDAVLRKTERILELTADAKNIAAKPQRLPVFFAFPRDQEWQRCVPSRSSDHVWRAVVEVHDRIIGPDADVTVIRENRIAEAGDLCEGFPVR